jgi:DNA-binding transcriptional ArsR family regulator
LRRKILRTLKEGHTTIEDLQYVMGLSKATLEWHLEILEYGFCVEKENKKGKWIYKPTQEGEVVDFLE